MPRPTPATAPRRPTTASSASAAAAAQEAEGTVRFSTQNWALLLAGLASIVGGYMLLGDGSTSLAALLLVLGYVVLIPLGIIR